MGSSLHKQKRTSFLFKTFYPMAKIWASGSFKVQQKTGPRVPVKSRVDFMDQFDRGN